MTCQIVYHNGNCLNTKRPFVRACRLCIDNCPHDAISEYRQIDTKSCTECGVCMAVCPSDGFVDRSLDKFYEYLSETEEVVLNCPMAVRRGFEIPCLGIFDRDLWITLMLRANDKTATLFTGVCAECDDSGACAISVRVFKQLHADWPEHPPISIQVRPDQGEAGLEETTKIKTTKPVNLRDLAGWRKKGLNKVEEWLPGLTADGIYSIPKSRQWLIDTLDKSGAKIPYFALTVSDECTNCGVCSQICPQGALQKREIKGPDSIPEDPKWEEKILSLRLIYEPQKCVHCQRCVEICQHKAISVSVRPLSQKLLTGKILIHEGSPLYCRECGKQIFDKTELCLVCSTNDPGSRGNFFS